MTHNADLRRLLDARGLSISEAARRLGVHRTALHHYLAPEDAAIYRPLSARTWAWYRERLSLS